jgi:hypothetical protein
MTWNHKEKLFAMGVTIQSAAGQFVLPTQDDLIGAANPTTDLGILSTEDPTETGAIWDAPRIYLGRSSGGSATIPLRGPGGSAPPAANAFALGRIMQGCGFSEIIRTTASAATALGSGSTTTSLVLNASESAVDDMLLGMPIQHPAIGTGFRQTSIIRDYVGATKTAVLAETLGSAPNGSYTLPASLVYLLGSLSVAPPLLSISIWRDRRRYDFMDCVITGWSIDTPVANEANQSFPSIQFSFKGTYIKVPGVVTTPTLPRSITGVSVPPYKGGKFYLDAIKLGHAGANLNLGITAGNASNANQDAGQDGADILSGSRTLTLDLNQMDVADFDLDARVDSQTNVPFLSTWGQGSGNNMGLMIQNIVLDPANPTGRNGYVALQGGGAPTDVDKSVALSFWW